MLSGSVTITLYAGTNVCEVLRLSRVLLSNHNLQQEIITLNFVDAKDFCEKLNNPQDVGNTLSGIKTQRCPTICSVNVSLSIIVRNSVVSS